MTIPYSAIALAGAVAAFFLGPKDLAISTAAVGVTTLACSILSLKQWKQDKQSTPYTWVSAGGALRCIHCMHLY